MYRLCTNIVVCFQLSHLNDDLTFLLLAVFFILFYSLTLSWARRAAAPVFASNYTKPEQLPFLSDFWINFEPISLADTCYSVHRSCSVYTSGGTLLFLSILTTSCGVCFCVHVAFCPSQSGEKNHRWTAKQNKKYTSPSLHPTSYRRRPLPSPQPWLEAFLLLPNFSLQPSDAPAPFSLPPKA
jgi:hypothetical protein